MKKATYLLLAAAVVAAAVGYRLWNKPHQDMAAAKADLTVDAVALYTAFDTDEAAANAQYLDKVIALSGKVKETVKDGDGAVKVSLESGSDMGVVACELSPFATHARTDFPVGETVTFKGKCTGLNLDVVFVECVEAK
jgi:long-subunit fatty acid transport protein